MLVLKLIVELEDKIKWQRLFRNEYDGGLKTWSHMQFADNVKFYVAIDGGKELGFIRINDKSSFFPTIRNCNIWNLTDAYVKPIHRNKGVLRKMITQAVAELDVKMMLITTDKFYKNKDYYFKLGFSYHYTVQNGAMTWAFLPSLAKNFSPYNDSSKKIAA